MPGTAPSLREHPLAPAQPCAVDRRPVNGTLPSQVVSLVAVTGVKRCQVACLVEACPRVWVPRSTATTISSPWSHDPMQQTYEQRSETVRHMRCC